MSESEQWQKKVKEILLDFNKFRIRKFSMDSDSLKIYDGHWIKIHQT